MFVVGCGEAVPSIYPRAPRPSIPVNCDRHVDHLGPRNPPARAGTFRGLFLVITVADGSGREMFVMGRDGLTGPLHEPYGALTIATLSDTDRVTHLRATVRSAVFAS